MQVIAGLEAPAVALKPAAATTAQPPPSPSHEPPQLASPPAAAPAAPAARAGGPAAPKKKVQIVMPVPSQKGPNPALQNKVTPGATGPKMPPRWVYFSLLPTLLESCCLPY